METLRRYLNSLPPPAQQDYARRCGTSVGYLRKAMSKGQQLGEKLVIALERESGAEVHCEDLRPDVDWKYLRTRRRGSPAEVGKSVAVSG